MEYTQQEINNFYSKYSCCFASLATDYINSLAIGAFDCGQKLNKLLQFKSYLDILKDYKVDTSVYYDWTYTEFAVSFTPDINTLFNIFIGGQEVASDYTPEECNNYLIGLGWEYNFNNNTDDGTFALKIPTYLLIPYTDEQDTVLSAPNDVIYFTTNYDITQGVSLGHYSQIDYTEEELNCITNDDLDSILFWLKQNCLTVKNKPTISEIECENTAEDEHIFQVNQTVIIQAGDSIEVERNGNTYTISNPLPDQEVTITAGANITVTGTYPNFTITSSGTPSGGTAWGAITGTLTSQTDLTSYLASNYYPLSSNPAGYLTNSDISATNGLTESPTNTFKLGGSLIENTTITSSTFLTTFTGAPALKPESLLNLITTSGQGSALSIDAFKDGIVLSSGTLGLRVNSSTVPIFAFGTSYSSLTKTGTATSTVDIILSLGRNNTGTLASLQNSGVALAFSPGEMSNNSLPSNSFIELIYEQPSNINTETKFRFRPLGAATNTFGYSLETFGSGKLKLPAYGQTPANFTGTAIKWLAVTSSGDVIEVNPPSGSTTWGSITGTLSSQTDLQTALNTKENSITIGTTAQYWRGDKSWQTLNKAAIGLSNVDNTSDSTKNSASATLTNKRITVRTGTTTSSATPTINTNNIDYYSITALGTNITSMTTNLSGTPTIGQTLWIAITDNGTARTITWGASFEASTVALPTTTVISTRLDVTFIWNEITSKWRCVRVA